MPARWAAQRRDALSKAFPGERLVIPAGDLKVRSNDTDYQFRPHTAFAHLTGLGADREPDAVLVLEPQAEGGHEAVLYARPMAPRDSEESFTNHRYGEFWIGPGPTLESLAAELGVSTAHLDQLGDAGGAQHRHPPLLMPARSRAIRRTRQGRSKDLPCFFFTRPRNPFNDA